MSATKYVRIERDDATDSWSAVCPGCKEVVYMVTYEAVAYGPRRPSGSSQLLPVTMSARHECEAYAACPWCHERHAAHVTCLDAEASK